MPLNHSSDRSGQKWNTTPTPFWTTSLSACEYCHGSTQHETSALGKASTALGSNSSGDAIGSGLYAQAAIIQQIVITV